ncbi:hypothetical protein IFM89_012890 [Coptis chinensis]|uniref:F-box associated beta-propeller type 3 domain-containing protein n=1 Tax=Coptis chinensis TaxID=261450 RepID=A0A835HCD8_9MAGN|nr:hypothetical protein IFM89_012890 [Coptis chinensis]
MVPSFISTFSNGNILHSLVYDSVSEKYKVVICGYSTTDGYTSKIITVGVEGDTWRDVIIPKPHRLCEYPPIFANGSLHLMMDSVDLENLEASFFLEPESLGKVLTMDVGREIFYTIPHPECNSGVYTLVEMEGLLCFVDHISNTQLQIWVLKDLELHEWNVKYRIDISHLKKVPFKGFLEDSFPFAITTTLKCKIIIKYYDSVNHLTQFFSYDMDRKQLDEERGLDSAWTKDLSEFEQKFYPLKHVNTLVSF